MLWQGDEALKIALHFAAILQRLLQLVDQIGRTEIEAPPRSIAEADQLLMRDVGQSDDAIVEAVFRQPSAPILDLNVVPVLSLLICGCTGIYHDGEELGRIGPECLGEGQCLFHTVRRLVQITDHKATVHHDASILAPPDKSMPIFVILAVATAIVFLLHAMDDSHVTAFEPYPEQPAARPTPPGQT